jgi:kynureninase
MALHGGFQLTRAWAEEQDRHDPLSRFRSEFHIPTLTDLTRHTLKPSSEERPDSRPSIYLCGNSLGLQPKCTADLIATFLTQWRTKGVKGHFVPHSDSPLAPFLHVDDEAAALMAPIVGALPSEVAVMGTLTANLHFLMSSFYRPDVSKKRPWKIMLEGKAFPSDHFAVESQIAHWGLDPQEAMVLLEPKDEHMPILKTEDILAAIDKHKDELALILLPGIQFYTGQYFEIEKITKHAHERGLLIGWDLAHAAGNVDLKLHDWEVDFAAWCTYKYLNSGPGAMAAIFVNENFGNVELGGDQKYRPRLSGWWGDDKGGRFNMTNSKCSGEGSGNLLTGCGRIQSSPRCCWFPGLESKRAGSGCRRSLSEGLQ